MDAARGCVREIEQPTTDDYLVRASERIYIPISTHCRRCNPSTLRPLMFDLPPGWLCVAVCAPALSSFAPLLFPASVSAVAASLGHADPPSLLATSSLLLSLLRLAALLQWWLQEPQVAPHLPLGLAPAGRRLYLLRLALALPLLAFGTALKAGAARALGVTGLFFGRQLGGRGLPWCTSWPYDVTGARRSLCF